MIKLSTTPINRQYWIRESIIYKIENKKINNGGAFVEVHNPETDENEYVDRGNYIPTINVYEYTNTDPQTYYLDVFIEDGDRWDFGEGGSIDKPDGLDIYDYFITKCEEEIKNFIKNRPNLTLEDVRKGALDKAVPSWLLDTDENFTLKVPTNDGEEDFPKISVETILSSIKNEIIVEELENTFISLVKKYNLPNNTTFCDFISTNMCHSEQNND